MVVRAQNSVRRQRAYVVLVLLFTAIHAQRPPLEQAQLATIADISQARHRALLQAGSAGGPSVEFLYALTTVEEGSLAVAQVAEVLAEIKLAISSYVSPTSADISAVVARALAVAGRHLLQAQSSLQPTVKFVSTLSSKPVGDPATVSQYQAAISDFLAPLAVQITTSAVGSNQLSTTVLFPPNNQVSTTPSQSTAAAQNFMQTVRDQPAAIFSTFDTVSASALQTNVALVQANPGNVSPGLYPVGSASPGVSPTVTPSAPAAQLLPPELATPAATLAATPAPTQAATPAPTQTATPAPTQAATPVPTQAATSAPTQTATPSPTQAATPPPTQAATLAPTWPASPAITQPATPAPTQAATSAPTQAATSAPTQPATPAPTQPSTPAPAPASHPLTVLVQVAFPQGAEQVAQSLVATLQAKPEDVFFAVAARNGPLTVSNVGYTPSPLPAPATAPPAAPVLSALPPAYPGPGLNAAPPYAYAPTPARPPAGMPLFGMSPPSAAPVHPPNLAAWRSPSLAPAEAVGRPGVPVAVSLSPYPSALPAEVGAEAGGQPGPAPGALPSRPPASRLMPLPALSQEVAPAPQPTDTPLAAPSPGAAVPTPTAAVIPPTPTTAVPTPTAAVPTTTAAAVGPPHSSVAPSPPTTPSPHPQEQSPLPASSPGLVLARPTPVPPQDDNSTSGIPQTTPAASGAMFAMNMQFTTGSASTDNPVNTIVLALDKTPTAPLASDFAVDLKPGTSGGSVAAVLPYLNDAFFLLRVDSPEGYIGPVTVAYPSSSVAPLTYHVKSRLVVKVTASSADGVQ